jgi:BASS family bile acid:Na+ symporter
MLLLAACPAAHYAMPFTKISKGHLAAAVGMLVVLAASTVVLAPVVLLALPLFSADNPVHVPASHVIVTLVAIVLVPLTIGVGLREWKPKLADRLQKPALRLSVLLNTVMISMILLVQGHQIEQVRLQGWAAMAVISVASLVIGWLLGGPKSGNRKALARNTVLRNMGPGLVIATGSFPGSPVAPVMIAATLVNGAVGLIAASWWGRRASPQGVEAAQAARAGS